MEQRNGYGVIGKNVAAKLGNCQTDQIMSSNKLSVDAELEKLYQGFEPPEDPGTPPPPARSGPGTAAPTGRG